tara:strand:- start:583 stop:753 length:171 start_codon:yes stop_codon:yes gene_type:complete
MKVDRYYDPYEDLEAQCLEELEHIAKSLGGNMTKLTRANSTGRSSKVIEIEYEINE